MPEEKLERNLPAVIPDPFRVPYQAIPTGWDPEPEEPAVPLSHYLWILKRHRWKILAFVATCVIATLIVSFRLTPIYESTAVIDIDRRMPTGILGQEATQSSTNDADQFLATQIKLIQADDILYIPDNTGRRATMSAIEKVLLLGGSLGSAAVYGVTR